MKSDASSIGLNLWAQSGYRSYDYQNDLYNTKFFLTIKFKDGEPKFNKIEDDVNEYFSLYADWINSFVESKSTIGNEVRYYNEEKQNKLFEETKDKLEELKIEIEKICFSV